MRGLRSDHLMGGGKLVIERRKSRAAFEEYTVGAGMIANSSPSWSLYNLYYNPQTLF